MANIFSFLFKCDNLKHICTKGRKISDALMAQISYPKNKPSLYQYYFQVVAESYVQL